MVQQSHAPIHFLRTFQRKVVDIEIALVAIAPTMIQCIYIRMGGGLMRSQILKWGNSLAVRIPKPIAQEAKLKAGDPLEIEVADHGSVQLHRIGKIPTLAELVSQIAPENRYSEISAGPEIGKEAVEW